MLTSKLQAKRYRFFAGVHAFVLITLFAIFQINKPDIKLYFNPWEFVYVAATLPFLIFSLQRFGAWWKTLVFCHVAFLVLHYQIHGGVSLINLSLAGLPAIAVGVWTFAKWNRRILREGGVWTPLGASLVAWTAMAFAFPPLPLGPAGFLLLAPWFVVLQTQSLPRIIFATFWSGMVYNAINYYWIFNVIKVGPVVVILLGLALLVVFFTTFHLLAAWLYFRGRHLHWWRWGFPFIWAGLEVLRTRGEFSFPWSHLGYVFGNHVEFLQLLPWIGVFGYTLLVVYGNQISAYAILQKRWTLLSVPLLLPALLWAHGQIVLWTDPVRESEDSIDIIMVQPSVLQTKKWTREYYDTVMTHTWSMLDNLETTNADLVVLPETAVPDWLRLRDQDFRRFRRYAGMRGLDVIVGALNFDREGTGGRRYNYYNSAYRFTPDGQVQEYRKIHLVPFSERIPMEDVFPLLTYVDLGEGDFTPGTELPVYGELAYTPNICYETIYPALVRRAVREGARVLVNITNDGWFGRSTAPGQHANLARYRSVENALPMARCANSGISVFYDHRGRDFERTELYEIVSVRHKLALRTQTTLYTRIGDIVEITLFIFFWLALFYALVFIRKNRVT